MNEKEIAKILKKHTCYEGPHVSSFDRIGAAHAIAEKMAEGVVAKIDGRWTTDDLGYHVLTVDSHSNWEGQKIRMATVMQGQLEGYYGQRVRVTVTKEEGDGQQ